MTPEEAVIQALALALTAPSEEQHNRALDLAERLASNVVEGTEVDDETFNRWLTAAKALVAANRG
jgi:hypothetical protein